MIGERIGRGAFLLSEYQSILSLYKKHKNYEKKVLLVSFVLLDDGGTMTVQEDGKGNVQIRNDQNGDVGGFSFD